eukprot:2320142-Pleurochrysis_carterae.AAC.2
MEKPKSNSETLKTPIVLAYEKACPQMQRDAAILLNLLAKFASPSELQLAHFTAMIDKSLRFQFYYGDNKSNGQITNGLVDRGENRACSARRLPFSPPESWK